MNEKISFPKGSLSFKRLKTDNFEMEKSDEWKRSLLEYVNRKKYIDVIHKTYPGSNEVDDARMPKEAKRASMDIIARMKDVRDQFTTIPSFVMKHNYEITFIHPKWSKVLGPIIEQSDKNSIKDSLKLIMHRFQTAKTNFRKIRNKRKVVKIKSLNADIIYNVSGGAIYMPEVKEGVYVKFLKDQEKRIVFAPKSPKDKANYIGVELEFLCEIDQEELGLKLFDAGVGKNVELTKDDSIKCCGYADTGRRPQDCDKHHGKLFSHELCILVKEDNYKEIIKKVCSVLSKANSIVNKSCGMHVHLDMRNRKAEQAYQNLISAQSILFKMNPKSRSEKYAKKVTDREFEKVMNTPDTGYEHRYLGINPIAMNRHSTIECRIHSGTIDFTKITNWIAILVNIANHKERIIKNYVSLNSFCEEFNIEGSLIAYMKERIEKFKSKKDILGTVDPEAEKGVA